MGVLGLQWGGGGASYRRVYTVDVYGTINYISPVLYVINDKLYNNHHLYSHKQLHVHGTYKALCTKLQLH